MTTAAEKTRQDVRAKYKLERKLIKKLSSLDKRIVKDFQKKYTDSGIVLNAEEYRDDLDMILQRHYQDVGDQFGNIISKNLPDDVAITEDEENRISDFLGNHYLLRADEQSKVITESNQERIVESVEEGVVAANEESPGVYERLLVAIFAARFLSRKLNAIRKTIAITETENSAELAKAVEAQVLSGELFPLDGNRDSRKSNATKEWVTVGDERVRETHVAADGQTAPVNQVYTVGGFSMMFPGDTNWGAPLSEVVNCRCSSQYDEVEIINFRRQRGQSNDS